MWEALRKILFLLLLLSVIGCAEPPGHGPSHSNTNGTTAAAEYTSSANQARTASVQPNNATCISRTVNYITHTLPQQCLRTGRTVVNVTQSGSKNITSELSADASNLPTDGAENPSAVAENGTSCANGTIATEDDPVATSSAQASSSSEHVNSTTSHSSSSAATETTRLSVPDSETETDSPLDNANFLSFEEWKKQNLAKAGQSPEHVGQGRQSISGNRQRPDISNALDTLGEENEIDLDFSGFGPHSPNAEDTQSARTVSSESAASVRASPGGPTLRSKDAGKTCKERTNYASFDCAATILKANPECKSAASVLVENKDSYMLNICSASNKFVVVELCDDILIDTIVLANYEFFSSVFRHFRVSVSDRYPVKLDKWKSLGTFEALNTREMQAFLVENPLIWARYLRIEFLSHYGNEYYCPLSLLRVHGTTMMEEFRNPDEPTRGEVAEEEPTPVSELPVEAPVGQETPLSPEEVEKATLQTNPTPLEAEEPALNDSSTVALGYKESAAPNLSTCAIASGIRFGSTVTNASNVEMATGGESTCPSRRATPTPSDTGIDGSASQKQASDTQSTLSAERTSATASSSSVSPQVTPDTAVTPSTASVSTLMVESARSNVSTAASEVSKPAGSVISNATAADSQLPTSKTPESTANLTSASSNTTRGMASTASTSHQPQPSTQESFFKSIHKRLQQLESNSTLSLQYIEEQSRILRDAFIKVEKRQVAATEKFLSNLNGTVMDELHGFRQAYDQLWQSTVIELEGQREQYQREMLALSTRLRLVADELVWQKRMSIVQSMLLFLCLGLVLFGRQGSGNLEMPLAQHLMSKSQAAFRAGWESEPTSPSSPVSRSPVSLFRRRVWRPTPETISGSVTDVTDSRPNTREGPTVQFRPPTPPTPPSDTSENSDEEDIFEEPDEELLRTQSGPATPRGTAAGLRRRSEWPSTASERSP